MQSVDNDFIAGCSALNGKIIRDKERVVCDFGNGELGLISDFKNKDFKVVDNRMKPHGVNTIDASNIDFIGRDNQDMIIKLGNSYMRVGREGNNIKLYTEVKPEPDYPEEGKLYSRPQREGCPSGMTRDPHTGECVKEGRGVLVPPKPPASSIKWGRSRDAPGVLINNTESIAKGHIKNWLNAKNTTIGSEFLSAKNKAQIKVKVGLEYKNRDRFGNIDHTIKIGPAVFNRADLYQVAEEIYGVKIMDAFSERPLDSEIGKEIMFPSLVSNRPDYPIVIKDVNHEGIYYLVDPIGG